MLKRIMRIMGYDPIAERKKTLLEVKRLLAARREKETPENSKKPYTKQILADLFPYSYYAYGTLHAAQLAQQLGIQRISVIEFGVAGGNGLVALETHAVRATQETGVEIDVYGFDTGKGLPQPLSHLDMPYRFAEGNYRMDVPKLKERLKNAELVLGDVRDTLSQFLSDRHVAPIGFTAFDMDLYSATMDAFAAFGDNSNENQFLPRVYMYFDDIIGNESSSYNDFVGELAAISEFNKINNSVKIGESRVFRGLVPNFKWYHQIYLMHRFKNNMYRNYISKAGPGSLSLSV